jgi:hypothetical protein
LLRGREDVVLVLLREERMRRELGRSNVTHHQACTAGGGELVTSHDGLIGAIGEIGSHEEGADEHGVF